MTDPSQTKITGGLARRKHSKWWYGRYKVDGKEYFKNLRVEVRGTPPEIDQEHGSIHYEKSRTEAEGVLRDLLREIESGKPAEELAQAVHEARTGGRRVKVYELIDLPDLWKQIPRTKVPTQQHTKQCLSIINGFIDFCSKHFSAVTKLDHLSVDHARVYMDWQEERGVSPKTWNDVLSVLKSAARRGKSTAFDDLKAKEKETVHRIPFTPEELHAIFDAARSDPFIYPLIVAAACTAMRRGDCCLLTWDAVDLKERFITVKTSKTKRTVDIPIADMLFDVISDQVGNGSKYVFPEQAGQYKINPSMLTARLRKVLAKAGFHDGNNKGVHQVDDYDENELREKVKKHIQTIPTMAKRERMIWLFDAYIGDMRMGQAAKAVGVSKASASNYLNELEAATGVAFIKGKKRSVEGTLPAKRGDIREDRASGLKKASVRDFHSFRTTWITLALCSGIPFELVQRVTGHATAEIVMEHYFKPHRAQLKEALEQSLPKLLSAGNVNPVDRLPDLLRGMTAENWQECRDEALELLQVDGQHTY